MGTMIPFLTKLSEDLLTAIRELTKALKENTELHREFVSQGWPDVEPCQFCGDKRGMINCSACPADPENP